MGCLLQYTNSVDSLLCVCIYNEIVTCMHLQILWCLIATIHHFGDAITNTSGSRCELRVGVQRTKAGRILQEGLIPRNTVEHNSTAYTSSDDGIEGGRWKGSHSKEKGVRMKGKCVWVSGVGKRGVSESQRVYADSCSHVLWDAKLTTSEHTALIISAMGSWVRFSCKGLSEGAQTQHTQHHWPLPHTMRFTSSNS